MINKALEPVVADGTVAGIGLWEITLSQGTESSTDHAAKWETSNMMFFYPELVELGALGDGPLASDMKAPDGIGSSTSPGNTLPSQSDAGTWSWRLERSGKRPGSCSTNCRPEAPSRRPLFPDTGG